MSREAVLAFELLCFIAWGIGLNFLGDRIGHRVATIVVFVFLSRIPYVRAFWWVAAAAAWLGMLSAHAGSGPRLVTLALAAAALCLANASRFATSDLRRQRTASSP